MLCSPARCEGLGGGLAANKQPLHWKQSAHPQTSRFHLQIAHFSYLYMGGIRT